MVGDGKVTGYGRVGAEVVKELVKEAVEGATGFPSGVRWRGMLFSEMGSEVYGRGGGWAALLWIGTPGFGGGISALPWVRMLRFGGVAALLLPLGGSRAVRAF